MITRTTIGALAALLICAPAAGAAERVSVSSHGAEGDAPSGGAVPPTAVLSATGRFVAFYSQASNLVAGDDNGASDVFVRDRTTGRTTRVSTRHRGGFDPAISADGNVVAYIGVGGRIEGPYPRHTGLDAFVTDRRSGRTVRVSRRFAGAPRDRRVLTFDVALSGNGRYIAYTAQRLIRHDVTSVGLFVYDRRTGRTSRVGRAGWDVSGPSLSADGSRLAFFLAGGEGARVGVYVLDRRSGRLRRVVATSSPTRPALSADGRHLAFERQRRGGYSLYVRDLGTGRQRFAGDGVSPTLSRHGGRIAFQEITDPRGAIGDNTGPLGNVIVRDVGTGAERVIDITLAGGPSGRSGAPALASRGHLVAFSSSSPDLVTGDANDVTDVFVAEAGRRGSR